MFWGLIVYTSEKMFLGLTVQYFITSFIPYINFRVLAESCRVNFIMAAILTEQGNLSGNHGFLTGFNFISGVSNARYIFHKKISLSELLLAKKQQKNQQKIRKVAAVEEESKKLYMR